MVKYYQDRKFLKLKEKWYRKLERSGFTDHEKDEKYLKQYSGKTTGRSEDENHLGGINWDAALAFNIRTSAKAEYYRWASHVLETHRFSSKFDKKVWELHAAGIGQRVIAKELKTFRDRIVATLRRVKEQVKGKK